MRNLNLNDLSNGFAGITPAFGEALAEAGGLCLESQGHSRGVKLLLRGYRDNNYSLDWPYVTGQIHRCYNDPEEATEWGAVGVAVLLAKTEAGYSVIERSRKGTGFDYWIGDETDLPFEKKARLEISGIRKGTNRQINARVKQKLKQVKKSGQIPTAYVIVVEFGTPLARFEKDEQG